MSLSPILHRVAVWLLLAAGVGSLAVVIGVSSSLVNDIRGQEAASARLVMRTTVLVSAETDPTLSDVYSLAGDILSGNQFTPVIMVDEHDSIVSTRNLPVPDSLLTPAAMRHILQRIKAEGDSVPVVLAGAQTAIPAGEEAQAGRQMIYFGQSALIDRLGYIRWLQVLAVVLLAVVVWMVVSAARRRERDSLWKGLALETAHQLGTPIAALGAWRELLATGLADPAMVADEMDKDVARLRSVSERFSHVGSLPQPLLESLGLVADYLRSRTPAHVAITVLAPQGDVVAPHDATLVRWAVENICKNAADAIADAQNAGAANTNSAAPAHAEARDARGGSITITLAATDTHALIDIADTGRGMDAHTRRHVFDAGFSTKTRGWGIGLALVRRIVEEYHHGRVFVAASQPGRGTTFRIMLPLK